MSRSVVVVVVAFVDVVWCSVAQCARLLLGAVTLTRHMHNRLGILSDVFGLT